MSLPLPCTKTWCLTFIIMDAGQGDATLVVLPDHSLILVDCGSTKNKQIVKTEINRVLQPYLAQAGNKLKALVLTHPDSDHYNLLNDLIIQPGIPIDTLIYSGKPSDYTVNKVGTWINKNAAKTLNQVATVFPMSSDYIHVRTSVNELSYVGQGGASNVETRILAGQVGNDSNTGSIVLLFTYFAFNIILMGDATEETEDFILGWNTLNGELTKLLTNRHTVLKAGHHGSPTSSSQQWLDAIKPEVVFISSDTKSFNGVSIPRDTVINRILAQPQLFSFPTNIPEHFYVQYNETSDEHEQISTRKALMTTLYLLNPTSPKQFESFGTSWYYTVAEDLTSYIVEILPAVSWNNIKTVF